MYDTKDTYVYYGIEKMGITNFSYGSGIRKLFGLYLEDQSLDQLNVSFLKKNFFFDFYCFFCNNKIQNYISYAFQY